MEKKKITATVPSALGRIFFSLVEAFFILSWLNPSNWDLRSTATLGRSFRDGLTGAVDILN